MTASQENVRSGGMDYLEFISRVLTLVAFGLAFAAALAAPLLAIQWGNRPFLGLLVEPTLVVTGTHGPQWPAWSAGVEHPQHILRVAGVAVSTPAEFDAVLAANAGVVGQKVSLLTNMPDGGQRLYPGINIGEFPASDFLGLFVLPYVIGLAYLGIGAWVYRTRGRTRPGRALAFFCACTALACLLLFDLSTTHVGPAIWTIALAQIGGALLSLALRFPEESRLVTRRPWLLGLPYTMALILGARGLIALADSAHPWSYIDAWRTIYSYIALGIIVFLAVMIFRSVSSKSPVARQQARIVLFGSLLSFSPLTAWFVASALRLPLPWDIAVFMPELLLFPLSVAIAIYRYRLLETELIINRTLVYGLVTALLAGAFGISVGLWQRLFVTLTGEKSDAAIIITSFLVASAFTPLKARLQSIVDKRLRQLPDNTRDLQGFGDSVQAYVEMREAQQVMRRLLDEAARGLQAESGAISTVRSGRMQTIYSIGRWKGEAWLTLPLECDGHRFGLLSLGPRRDRQQYPPRESEILQRVTKQVARSVCLDLGALSPGVTSPQDQGWAPYEPANGQLASAQVLGRSAGDRSS